MNTKANANRRYAEAIQIALDNATEVIKDSMPTSREQSLALTKIQEAKMWAMEGLGI